MPTDKLIHMLAGIAIAAVVYPFGILWACLAVLVAATGKEAYDSTGRGHVELMDAVATVADGAVLVGVVPLAKPSSVARDFSMTWTCL